MPTVRSPTLKLNSPCYPCVCLSRDRYYLSSVTLNLFMGCPGVPCWKALSFSFGTRLFQIPYSTYNEARKKRSLLLGDADLKSAVCTALDRLVGAILTTS